MAFWKGLQMQTEHLPFEDLSHTRQSSFTTYGRNLPGVPSWMLSNPRQCAVRWYHRNAMTEPGYSARWVSPHHMDVRISTRFVDQFNSIDFQTHIPVKVHAQLQGPSNIPLVHWGNGRFGLASKFPLQITSVPHLVLHVEFDQSHRHAVDTTFTDPIGLHMTTHSLDANSRHVMVIPVHAGHAHDHDDNAFLCMFQKEIRLCNKIDAIKWIAQTQTLSCTHVLDKHAIVWQRRYRKRSMARAVYDHTNLPRDMCKMIGAYASGKDL
jgi:hypothetical protein